MGVQSAAVLYPVNTTTVDSGTGIDIRLLDSAQAGATDTTQDCDATNSQDNADRTFDPGSSGVTAANDPLALQKIGWALRLADDMTPGDDTNCNAILVAQTLTVSISAAVDQSGGTYIAGSYGPLWYASLWEYDPATDTGTLIASGSDSATTWDYTPVTGDIGTFKTIAISLTVAADWEFTQDSTLLLQVGLDTQTIPNPTLGSATWTYTLAVDDANTNITWESGKEMSQVCFTTGSSSASATASGDAAIVLPTEGASSGSATATATIEADAEMTGTAAGVAVVSGTLEADAEMTGAAAGAAAVAGELAGVKPTIGEVDIGSGVGGGDIYPVFGVFD